MGRFSYATCYLIAVSFFAFGCGESVVEPILGYVPEIKGFSYTSFTANGFTLGGKNNAVAELKTQINNEWVALVVFEFQSTPQTADIAPNTTGRNPLTGEVWSTSSTDEDVREGVRDARLQDMKIMLKPHIDLYTGEWRAAIQPDDQGNWFRTYTQMILKYTRLAVELNIEMLCIGTEYVVATQSRYTSQWSSVIDSIRQYYSGKLIYAANWSGAHAYGLIQPEFEQVEFWDKLDYIGIDAYYPITNSRDDPIPPVPVAVSKLSVPIQAMSRLSQRYHKPIIITEVGIQSVQGALATPWEYSLGSAPDAVQDNQVQEFYYRAMIESFGKQPWCAGMFWWNWESVRTSFEATNYTPRNKPAAVVLRQWYSLRLPA
ncbi:MAG: hypothetical protein HY707_02390 [Ignavibacteriae bacterium]|nr:hypothetical protein [Ignavibacteriota bacterium]